MGSMDCTVVRLDGEDHCVATATLRERPSAARLRSDRLLQRGLKKGVLLPLRSTSVLSKADSELEGDTAVSDDSGAWQGCAWIRVYAIHKEKSGQGSSGSRQTVSSMLNTFHF